MPIINQEKWNTWVGSNKDDPYGKCCVDVARKVMEFGKYFKGSGKAPSISAIEKEIDKEYYLSDYNDDFYANDFREYKARRERLAQSIHNLLTGASQ